MAFFRDRPQVFNEKMYSDSLNKENSAYRIKIIPSTRNEGDGPEPALTGILTKPFSYSIDADWGTLGYESIIEILPNFVQRAVNLSQAPLRASGLNVGNAGLVTKKYYKQSGYLKINPSFRVVDWNGNGDPLGTSVFLTNLAIPKRTGINYSFVSFMKALKVGVTKVLDDNFFVTNKVAEGVLSIGEAVAKWCLATGEKFSDYTIEAVGGSDLVTITKSGKDAVNEIINKDSILLTASPTPVRIIIGNYFDYSEMVIENVSCEFSQQMTENGPLYADFTLSLSSREVITINNDGFGLKGSQVNIISNPKSNTNSGIQQNNTSQIKQTQNNSIPGNLNKSDQPFVSADGTLNFSTNSASVR